jgi:GTP-binding protein
MGLGMGADISFTVLHPDQVPEAVCPRWAVLGRSNVGKSSLLNALVHPKVLFRTGQKPGVTTGLIGVKVKLARTEASLFEIVDLPGFGFAERSQRMIVEWSALVEALRQRSEEKGLLWVWLVDPQREPEAAEHELLNWLAGAPYMLVFTKADRIKGGARPEAEKRWSVIGARATEGPYWTSAKTGDGVEALVRSARGYVRMHAENPRT